MTKNKSRSAKKKMVNISFTLPPDLESELDDRCQREDMTKSQVIRRAILDYLNRLERKAA